MVVAGRGRDHRHRALSGRDPREAHRTATPLELLYDLTFVVALGTAADELAHYLAEDALGRPGTLFPGESAADVLEQARARGVDKSVRHRC
jgi:hypothetical protein